MKKYFIYLFLGISMVSCKKNDKIDDPIIPIIPDNPPIIGSNLLLKEGFSSQVIASELGKGRHLVVNENGDIYMILKELNNGKGIVALRDEKGNQQYDKIEYFGDFAGTGIDIYNGYLYASSDVAVYRFKLGKDLVPEMPKEVVISGFIEQDGHNSKPFTFDDKGYIYVDVGAPSNACMEETRTPGSPGLDPCPQLELQSGVWRFDANKLNQDFKTDGYRFATGIRNAVSIDYNNSVNQLYVVQHGRDQLHEFFPEHYTEDQGVNLPAEEFFIVKEGANYGWPYCYYDGFYNDKKVLAPEYSGDGEIVGSCEDKEDPIMAFPAHLAPNDLLFYTADQFPEYYKDGAFVAFHGSWNRSPQKQEGYFVVFVPFNGSMPSGNWEVFADNFAELEEIYNPTEAKHRPMGLAVGPNGDLFVSDSVQGKIWKISYKAS